MILSIPVDTYKYAFSLTNNAPSCYFIFELVDNFPGAKLLICRTN
jgi:hypothetical protein